MTREKLQQVRDILHGVVSPHVCDNGCRCDDLKAALTIIAAELALPEAREWQVTAIGNLTGNRLTPDPAASMDEAIAIVAGLPSFRCIIESRTPAGPWEAAQ